VRVYTFLDRSLFSFAERDLLQQTQQILLSL